MKCPYCGREMELGLISSPQELSWVKGGKKPLFGKAGFHNGAVRLSEFSFVRGSAVAAFLCRDCEKVVIDYSKG